MKTIFYILILLLSITGYNIAQVTTFEKTLPDSTATQIFETEDGGYLLNFPDTLKFIKTNSAGYIEWIKKIPEIKLPGKKIIKTLDGGFAAVGTKYTTQNENCIIKIDSNFDTVWTKTYGPGNAQSIIQLPNGNFIISLFDNGKFFIKRTDSNGSLIWAKQIAGLGSFVPSYLVNLNDGNFLFGKRSTIIKMNSDADTLWIKTVSSDATSYFTNDGNILFSYINSLEKLDLDGNTIWHKTINKTAKAYTQTVNGDYVLITGTAYSPSAISILVTDTSGNEINEAPFENYGEAISLTSDGGFVITGMLNDLKKTWLLKTDSNLDYAAINILKPLDGDRLNIFCTYSIIWKANNVDYVNIDFSADNQNTWNNIVNMYSAETETFNWTLPDMPSGNLFIRISDSFNPDVYDRSDPQQTTIIYQATDYIAANEILMWIGNNGMNAHDPVIIYGPGFFWPGGEDATISAIYEDGLVWGAKVNGETRVNGSTYRYGLTPGYITESGLPSDPLGVKSKIFKLKKNWQQLPPGAERDRYQFDYLNWPVDVGAPWKDNNGDGIYTPGIDEPKIIGDETLFFVANDLDTVKSLYTYGSNPIGLEFQVTTFGYNSELLKDVVFKKFRIINKSSEAITDMYLTYFADDDLGFAGDDFVGCDTLLNLGYTYNGDNNDEGYYGSPPPAVGHLFVQPPIVQGEPTDSARFNNGWKKGFKNIPITAFLLFINQPNTVYSDPELGNHNGTVQFYNCMHGLFRNGDPIIDPNTNLPTHFCLAGDPVTGTGWNEWNGWPGTPTGGPNDRRSILTSGGFNMATNDTQEVVVAILIRRGNSYFNSITELKNYASAIQYWYDNDFVTNLTSEKEILPSICSLSQNYPNPFNPNTTIKYSIPNASKVRLTLFNLLGEEVTTLVNEEKIPGNYSVEFNASALTSGVYFYQFKAGEFIQTKKIIFLK